MFTFAPRSEFFAGTCALKKSPFGGKKTLGGFLQWLWVKTSVPQIPRLGILACRAYPWEAGFVQVIIRPPRNWDFCEISRNRC